MRFRLDIGTNMVELPWNEVFSPARAVAYDLIRGQDEPLATMLHDVGWADRSKTSTLRPLAVSPPRFRGAPKRHGVYTTSGQGSIVFASPIPRIAGAMLAGLVGRSSLRWGSAELTVRGVEIEPVPDHSLAKAVFSTVTPTLLRFEDRFITPDHPRFQERLEHNIRHKADVLGLPGDVELNIESFGAKRHFLVQGAPRIGCSIVAHVAAAPALLDALYEWGLGLANNQGFGVIL
jgi:CRISPR-associated endoribonuclease Cas6